MRETPGRSGEESPEKEEPPKKGILKKLSEHPLAKAALISGALHLPLQKDVGNALERAAHETTEAMKDVWDREHRVLDPQSKEQKAAVRARVADREGRIDRDARLAYKAEAAKKLEAGEGPSFKRVQFDLEKLNGMPPDEVAKAERKADELIAKYAVEVGNDLDEEELKRISSELYGPDKAYDWGQASVTRYFNDGERNCVAISRAQSIVLEGVLAKLPPEKRAHWRQTTQIVKQHEIAGIEHVGDDGKRDALYLLEGKWTRKWTGTEEEPGTATLQMDMVKKALVSSSPVEVKAAGKPGEVKDSPRIDAVTDEPAALNVKVEGKLKGAEFNVQQAKRDGIEPRPMTEAELAALAEQEKRLEGQVMEIELLTDPGPEKAKQRVSEGMDRGAQFFDPKSRATWFEPGTIDARDFDAPSKETVAALGQKEAKVQAPSPWRPKKVHLISYGTMEAWPPDALRQALENDVEGLSVQTVKDGCLSENFLREIRQAGKEGRLKTTQIRVEYGGRDRKTEGYVDPSVVRELTSVDGVKTVDLTNLEIGSGTKRPETLDAIKNMPAGKTVLMNGSYIEPEHLDVLYETKGMVRLPYEDYARLIGQRPDILDHKNVLFNEKMTREELESLRTIVSGLRPGHPVQRSLEQMIKALKEGPPMD